MLKDIDDTIRVQLINEYYVKIVYRMIWLAAADIGQQILLFLSDIFKD